METIIILTLIALIITALCIWKKPKSKIFKRGIIYLHLLSCLLFIIALFLLPQGYQFNGQYSNAIIALSFVLTAVLVFGVATSVLLKYYSGFFFVVSAVFEIGLLFTPNPLMLFYALTIHLFQPPYLVQAVNTKTNIECYEPFIGPPQIYLSEKKYGIFKKQISLSQPISSGGGIIYPISRIIVFNVNDTQVDCNVFDENGNALRDTLEIR